MVVYKVTKKMVEYWLGTDNQLKEAIEVIEELANGQYTIDNLNEDIISTYDNEEERRGIKIVNNCRNK